MKPAPAENARAKAADWLRQGQALEAQDSPSTLVEAVQAYDVAIALLRTEPLAGRDAVRHELGVAWMNRGNALQKQGHAAAVAEAVLAYDAAIAVLQPLPIATDPVFCNCLGAAWLNRGHAQLQLDESSSLAAALHSHEEAVALLRQLPFNRVPVYRLNLAGALVNLANALLSDVTTPSLERARTFANEALALVAAHEGSASEFADLGLKARRAQCDAIGRLLVIAGSDTTAVNRLADEASDAVDSGLALARRWEDRGVPHFRPLAGRLFFFGAQLYQLHQPQFLAEFLLENLDPAGAPAAWTANADLHEIAVTTVRSAREALARRSLLGVSESEATKLLGLSRELAAAEQRLTGRRESLPRGSAVAISAS